jgi:hypothetical protein
MPGPPHGQGSHRVARATAVEVTGRRRPVAVLRRTMPQGPAGLPGPDRTPTAQGSLTGVSATCTILPMALHAARQRWAVLEILGAAVLFGTTVTTASFAPPGATSISIGSARLVIGGAGLVVALPRLGGSRRRAIGRWRNPWGFTAGVMTALYQLASFAGVSWAGVAPASVMAASRRF